ncbi:MAG: metallopeptidase TldD-related protein [Candidatus Eisenbacteria bacterium]
MKEQFFDLVDRRSKELQKDEVLLANLDQETSDFVRWNGGRIRQCGTVDQAYMNLNLIRGDRSCATIVSITGDVEADDARCRAAIDTLRERLGVVPADPFVLYSEEVHSTDRSDENRLPDPDTVLRDVEETAAGLDFVGSLACGPMRFGFANSLGQRNWEERHSFLLDWSLFHVEDRAVKASYSGFEWDSARFRQIMESTRAQLEIMKREPRTVAPGKYRVYLAPAAVQEFLDTMSWGAFGLRAHRTKQSNLLRLSEGELSLDPRVTLRENTRGGIAPGFQSEGYLRPDEVVLVEDGKFRDPLVSPRSSKEFGAAVNAGAWESPISLDLAPGGLAPSDVLRELGTGLYVNNLWYMNFSDRTACRMTGMTRFATFWVEDGEIVAPVKVMRFDESAYRVLGSELQDLTSEPEFLVVSDTYGGRSSGSHRVPGILLRNFEFTL